ncbi:MAG: hypothetical protein ACOYYU_19835 [Chloroflexota bacterium]
MSRHILPILTFLLALTACSPAVPLPTATATYTVTRPAPTATVPPTPTETPDWLPEGLRGVQERLTPGGFELVGSQDGYYEIIGVDGQKVEGVKVFEDGVTELTLKIGEQETVLTTGAGAVTSHEGKLVWGLRQWENGGWSRPRGKTATEAAAGFEADYPYSLEIDLGSEKKDQMIATMFAEHERAMAKSETYDPASEFEGITVTTNKGTKYEKTYTYDEILPKEWYFINDASMKGVYCFSPLSKNSDVVYEDGSSLEYARPMQVALGGGWEQFKIINGDGSERRFLLAPVLAMDGNAKIRLLRAVVRDEDVQRIAHLFTPEERGKLYIWMFGKAVSNSYAVADTQLIGFTAGINGDFLDNYPDAPEVNELHTVKLLPEGLERVLFVFFAKPENLQ